MSFQDIPDSAALTLYLQGTYPPVASACLFLYDYVITLGDEVHHIWGTRGGTGKLLFMLTRYLTFGDIALAVYRNTSYFLTESTCRTLYEVSGAFAIAGIIIAETILVLRVWAIWDQSRRIGIFILAVFGALIIASAVTFVHANRSSNRFIELSLLSPSLVGCLPEKAPDTLMVPYLSVMIFELLMAFLLLLRGMKDFRQRSSSFLYRIYRDGFAYYAILSLVSILNVVFVSSGSRELANLLMAPQRVLHSILSARMILRLREDSFRRQLCDTVTQPLGEFIFLPTIYTPTISPADELTTRGTLDFDGGVDLGRCYRHEDRKQCHNGCYSRPKPGGL